MRNLKRALSLGLTAAMISGLMVMGSSAAGYADVTSEQNQEAIEVLQAVGIMVGDENGNFNPDAQVTRNEMAVVMSNLMEYNVATYSGTSPFTDVPSWAEPYVAACWTNGITAGYSDTTYGGSDTVTTAQAALMLMKALGYFQYSSDFGDDWQLATITQGNKIVLFEDVDSNVRDAMTRNDLAQLVLNTLEAGTVEAETDGSITVGDIVINGSVTYNYVTSGQSYARSIKDEVPQNSATSTSSGQYIVELGERLYQGDLNLNDDTTDNFGAPANRWTYNNSEIGTYAEEADYVFEGTVKSSEMNDAVGNTVVDDYRWEVLVDGYETYVDSDGATQNPFTQADVDDDNDDLKGTGRGTTTYVYLDDDAVGSYDGTATVVIVNTYAAEITRVDDGTITLDDMDDSGLEFDVEGYDEEDVVLYTKSVSGSGNWTVEQILGLADRVEGEATTIRDEDRVTVDGTTYRYSVKFNDQNGFSKLGVDSVDETVAFYLDTQGNIIMVDEADEASDYAYVLSVGSQDDLYGGSGTYGARLILADGTVMRVTLDDDTADRAKDDTKVSNANPDDSDDTGDDWKVYNYYINRLVSYSEEDDGTYSMNVVGDDPLARYTGTSSTGNNEDIIQNGTSRIKLPGSSNYIYADSNTAFLINDADDEDDDFNAYVGYENVPDMDALVGTDTTQVIYYLNSRGVARAVVMVDADVKGTANDVIFVVGQDSPRENGTGSNRHYVYDAVVNGEVTELEVRVGSTAAGYLATLDEDEIGVYFGLSENSNGYVTNLTPTLPSDVEVNGVNRNNQTSGSAYANGDYSANVYAGTQRQSSGNILGFGYYLDSNNRGAYRYRTAANSDATIVYYDGDDLTVGGSVRTDTNDEAYVITDDGEVIAIFVSEVENGETGGGGNEVQNYLSSVTVNGSTYDIASAYGTVREAVENATEIQLGNAPYTITVATALNNGTTPMWGDYGIYGTRTAALNAGSDLTATANGLNGQTINVSNPLANSYVVMMTNNSGSISYYAYCFVN